MQTRPWRILSVLLALAAAGGAAAGEAPREFATDRPDATEGALTVGKGRVQLEWDVARYTRDEEGGVRVTEWRLAAGALRWGLAADFEVALQFEPHVQMRTRGPGGGTASVRGAGDTTVRGKWNLTGNDGGGFAAGVIADVVLPTGAKGISQERWGGAVAVPVGGELGRGWEWGAMTAVEWVPTGAGRRPVWFNSAVVARELGSGWGGFLELTSAAGDGAHVAMFNCGVTRPLGPERQLDFGINLGLSRTAPDLGVFAGWSQRF